MVLLPNRNLIETDREWVIKDSDNRCYFIYGNNNDDNLIKLIPHCDDYQKWESLCHDCHSSASFVEFARILCRKCRNIRRASAKKFEAESLEKDRKRTREPDSLDKNLVKKTLNLSLDSSADSNNTENEIEE